ncbi:MAG TPA: metalloregulator ArsR/SmtB family transcription factor [Jatrophihabitans sp.]|jgi:DNA-binding transcriptional ArsR family regulator
MTEVVHGEADVAPVAALFADPARARILSALTDGRALAASVLADEAGVAASTASEHLSRLVDAGLLSVERSGRHRYYRLADDRVAAVLESLSLLAPARPVRSLRQSTKAAALRRARTCYDHLAGRLGVAVTEALVRHDALMRTDGGDGVERASTDRLSAPVPVHPYRLGPEAEPVFARLGVDLDSVQASRRPVLRFCVDWSEQRHHLAGALGAAVLARFESEQWVRRLPSGRALELTTDGRDLLGELLGVAA